MTPQKILESLEIKITFLDLETTDKNPNTTEILTAFLRTRRLHDFEIIDEDYLTFKPENYLHESYAIHGISHQESLLFDDKWSSFRKLLRYFVRNDDSIFCCHANHLTFGSYGYFDGQVIKQVCLAQSQKTYYWYLKQKFQWISTHTIAKNSLKLDRYGLDDLARFFGFKFKHHDAESDVEVMEKIFLKLVSNYITLEELLKIGNYEHGNNRRYSKQSGAQLSLQIADFCTGSSFTEKKIS